MMSIATFCHGPSDGRIGVSGAWYLLYGLSLEADVQPVCQVRATSSADVVVVSPKSCLKNVLCGQVDEHLVEETLGQITGKVVSWKVRS